jgi:hypothetical protein
MKNDATQWRAGRLSSIIFCVTMLVAGLPARGRAQVNSGSNGSDGAFNPTATNTVINMADHPTGIYQYTSVNIPAYVTVTFIPNANNTPVYWLVQSGVTINGTVNGSGQSSINSQGALGGPAGYRGGNGANGNSPATSGQGPGGGPIGSANASNGSYTYGNTYLIPLLGGSGGGGATFPSGGGGGGGAILIAASTSIVVNGSIFSNGGGTVWVQYNGNGGSGSGGAIRLVASQLSGNGQITANGGGQGRIRFDTYDNEFSGGVYGQFTSGSQFTIIPTAGQLPQLTVTSVGGVPVSTSPTGVLSTPDAVISAQQSSPMPVVVNCANLPLGTAITVTIKPMTGSSVSAVGNNNAGTLASSTATISINIPRGGGLIYATAAMGN